MEQEGGEDAGDIEAGPRRVRGVGGRKEKGHVMERWTWPFILQQVIVLSAWCWVGRVIWSEVRGLMEEAARHEEEA